MLQLRDIMTQDVATVTPETTLREAIELLAARHVSGAPVVTGRKVVGVISAGDLLSFVSSLPGVPSERDNFHDWDEEPEDETETGPDAVYFAELWGDAGAELTERFDAIEGTEWDILQEHTVAEAMTRVLHALPSTAEIVEAAERMREASVHRILVVDDGELVGIISTMDLARIIAKRGRRA